MFRSGSQKEVWWERLSGLIATERSHSPAGASINITYFHPNTNFEHVSQHHKVISLYLECDRGGRGV